METPPVPVIDPAVPEVVAAEVAPVEPSLRKLEILEARVDVLQSQSAEKKKAWYKTPATVISVTAILISTLNTLGTQVYAALDKAKEREATSQATKIATLGSLASEVSALVNERVQIASSGKQVDTIAASNSILRARIQVLLERSNALVAELGPGVSPAVLRTLAANFSSEGKPVEAERLLQLALRNANGMAQEKLYVLRALAGVYMTPDRDSTQVEQGRAYLLDALAQDLKQGGDFGTYERASTLLLWSQLEALQGNTAEARKRLGEARGEAALLNRWSAAGLRQELLKGMDRQEQFLSVLANPKRPTFFEPHAWLGVWRVAIANGRSGRLQVVQNAQTQALETRMELFQGERLAEQYSGIATVQSPYEVRVDWGSAMRFVPPGMTAGYLQLRMGANGGGMSGTMHLAGEDPAQAALRRIAPITGSR